MEISRHYSESDFLGYPSKLTIENKIAIFADRVRGWQLYPAEEVIEILPHSGFILLYSLLHYFEMIGKYIGGYTGERDSPKFFKIGFKQAAKYLGLQGSRLTDNEMDNIYNKVRNALYHTGLIGKGVILTSEFKDAIKIANNYIIINPHKLVIALQKHFDSYLEKLNNINEKTIRQNFEKRFDYLNEQ